MIETLTFLSKIRHNHFISRAFERFNNSIKHRSILFLSPAAFAVAIPSKSSLTSAIVNGFDEKPIRSRSTSSMIAPKSPVFFKNFNLKTTNFYSPQKKQLVFIIYLSFLWLSSSYSSRLHLWRISGLWSSKAFSIQLNLLQGKAYRSTWEPTCAKKIQKFLITSR